MNSHFLPHKNLWEKKQHEKAKKQKSKKAKKQPWNRIHDLLAAIKVHKKYNTGFDFLL